MTHPIHTLDHAKARAKAIRASCAQDGRQISHAASLERTAHEQGCSDWNVLAAKLASAPELNLRPGDRVAGVYLKRPFLGRIVGTRMLGDGHALRVEIHFDEPVNIVEFESFSNLRRRINATITVGGVTQAKTRDGVPHLVVTRQTDPIV